MGLRPCVTWHVAQSGCLEMNLQAEKENLRSFTDKGSGSLNALGDFPARSYGSGVCGPVPAVGGVSRVTSRVGYSPQGSPSVGLTRCPSQGWKRGSKCR